MTHLCVMCGKPKETPGWSVCDSCHEKGRLALLDAQKRQAPAPMPQYERD
jgi:NMD protein affecting ribosome stability and mRNA decay